MQQLMIQGNLTKDPETASTAQGIRVCNFVVAVDQYLGGDRRTEYFRVSAWREMSEACARYLRKGSGVIVLGQVTAHAYQDKTGKMLAGMDVRADRVHFMPGYGRADDGDLPY